MQNQKENMQVKRTKKGYSITMSYSDRHLVFGALNKFFSVHAPNVRAMPMEHQNGVMYHLHYSILHEIFERKNFQFQTTIEVKWSCSRAEAIALMWLLRDRNEIELLHLKSEIHKQLHA